VTKPPDWVEFASRAAYLPGADALVFADVHAGRDAASDVALPLGEREDLLGRLRAHLDRFEPARVVVAGDLLHVHGSIPDGVRETVDALLTAAEASGATLEVLRGNHDTMLAAVDVDALDHVELADGTVVAHGHEAPPAGAPRYVVGHQHPAVEIEGQRHPCFLHGPDQYDDGADVLVLPAFTRLAAGTPVESLSDGAAVSPLLADPSGYRPVVVSEGEALGFPALGDLRGLL
jgi:putative SbcD/Mre11-related phosphoesterase